MADIELLHWQSHQNADFVWCPELQIENLVLQHEEYPNFCQLDYSSPDVQCINQLTPLPFFFEFNDSARQYGDFRQSLEEGVEELRQVCFSLRLADPLRSS